MEQEGLCRMVHPFLRWGMILSLALMVLGSLLAAVTGVDDSQLVPLDRIPSELLSMDPDAFLSLGLVLLIATPLSRVIAALAFFIATRETRFVLISAIVLGAVTVAVVIGAA